MGLTTLIAWCHATVNFWWGCAKISAGCRNCYAEGQSARFSHGRASWGPAGSRYRRPRSAVLELLKLEQRAVKSGQRLRVFINSMADVFEDRRDLDPDRLLFFLAAKCVPHLDLLLLTKRIDRVEDLIPDFWKNPLGPVSWPRNVWLGFSAEDQANFDSRWPVAEHLARRYFIPVLFCSAEPLLGPIDIAFAERCPGGEDEPETRSLDWLIVGGESGPGARDCNIMWIADLVNQARGFEIPVFVKQVGSRPIMEPGPLSLPCEDPKGGDPSEWPECLRLREFPEVSQ